MRQHPIERALAAAAVGDRLSDAQLAEIRSVCGDVAADSTAAAVRRVLKSIKPRASLLHATTQDVTNALADAESAAIMTDALRDAWGPPASDQSLPC
jgi:hypothetical protein